MIGGKFKLKERTFTTVLTLMLHRDPKVWGDSAETFNPDNFSREAIAERPANAYKPFGNGQRACIGRQFAMQEAVLVIGMILQRFELVDHTNWNFKIKESMSIKPDGLTMRVRLRKDVKRSHMVPGSGPEEGSAVHDLTETAKRPSHGTPALILYGSNLGTTEDYARSLARTADLNGFDVTLSDLDAFAGKLPSQGAVLIACASYNGTPPDNAKRFVEWIQEAAEGTATGVKYAVFGCGHSDWSATYQATPRLIDEALARLGGERILDRAEGDAREDIDEQFDGWVSGLWSETARALSLDLDVAGAGDAAPLYQVERLSALESNPVAQQTGSKPGIICENRELQNSELSGRSTRHLEIDLPEGFDYQTGDHLCVVPANSEALVGRVMRRFGFTADAQIRIQSASDDHSQLPLDTPISVRRLLSQMMELQTVAARRDVARLAKYTECPHSGPRLQALAGEDYKSKVQQKRLSVLDLLEEFEACQLPFGVFLELMPMLTPRYYSISSSSAVHPKRCSITVGVVDEPSISGRGQFKGVCSNFLSERAEGEQVEVSIRSTSDGFRLPDDPDLPIIMIGPGTGIAPFRGFLQERAQLLKDGKTLGPAKLFFGCRHPDQDFIYQEELEAYNAEGIVDLHVAFSRVDKSKTYVQDLIREQRDDLWQMISAGARIFVCGDGSRMEPDVRRALSTIYSEEMDVGVEAADAWMEQMSEEGRYVLDVWVSS